MEIRETPNLYLNLRHKSQGRSGYVLIWASAPPNRAGAPSVFVRNICTFFKLTRSHETHMDRQRVYWCTALSIITRVFKLCDFIGFYLNDFTYILLKWCTDRAEKLLYITWYDFLVLFLSLSLKQLSSDIHILCILHLFHWNDGVLPPRIPATKVKSIVFARFKFWKQIWNQNEIINRTVFFKF
jgi:hypothetical protein